MITVDLPTVEIPLENLFTRKIQIHHNKATGQQICLVHFPTQYVKEFGIEKGDSIQLGLIKVIKKEGRGEK